MYLHYYLNEKYVGPVDIEVFFDSKQPKTLVACSPECSDLLLGLELVYGKKIPSFTRDEMFDLKQRILTSGNKANARMSNHVFTTKKCGPFLAWNDYDRTLACKL